MQIPEDWRRRRKVKLNTEEKADHAISVHDYPELDLDENEYIVIDLERTKLFPFLMHAAAIIGYIFFALIAYFDMSGWLGASGGFFSVIGLLATFVLAMVCYAALWIYNRNRMIVSNQRIFNKIQSSLFMYKVRSIELDYIEDVSYSQYGIFANIFDYGSIWFSTVGSERNTYKITFVNSPEKQTKILKKAIHDVDSSEVIKIRKARESKN